MIMTKTDPSVNQLFLLLHVLLPSSHDPHSNDNGFFPLLRCIFQNYC
ncbi:hypothetical protein [Escherichia phage BI-EHEC]|nr:hypothetical protein [Escherichia phage BI-EHEC]